MHALSTPDSWSSAELLARYAQGDERVAPLLFERYVARLTALVRSRLGTQLAARTDPEDVVLSAYRSFFLQAREGRFELRRSGDLWRLLVALTLHKLYRQVRRHRAGRRDVRRERALSAADESNLAHDEPTPAEAAAAADELTAFLATLDLSARRIIELRLQDLSQAEIARQTGRSERTVRRILAEAHAALRQRLAQADHAP